MFQVPPLSVANANACFSYRRTCTVLVIVCPSSQSWIVVIKEDTWYEGERKDVLVRLCGSLGWCFVARHEVRLNLKQEALSRRVGMF